MVYATFNNVSVIYHSFAVGRGIRRLMFYATFNIVSVICHTFAIGGGGEQAHVFLTLSIMIRSFTTALL
jgi:hypothetical protein